MKDDIKTMRSVRDLSENPSKKYDNNMIQKIIRLQRLYRRLNKKKTLINYSNMFTKIL